MSTLTKRPNVADAVSARLAQALKRATERAATPGARVSKSAPTAADAKRASAGAVNPASATVVKPASASGDVGISDEFAMRLSALLNRKPAAADAVSSNEAGSTETVSAEAGAGPVGAGAHVVKQGECVSSIAKRTGHFWETIWDDAKNAKLKEIRRSPNVLLPGDRVTVPALERKCEAGATEQRHRFVRRGEPSVFRLRLRDNLGNPRGNEAYRLVVDDQQFDGTTDAAGLLQEFVPGDAQRGTLHIGSDRFTLNLHGLDPVESVSGVQARLRNLGFYAGAVDGAGSEALTCAVERYQQARGLSASGEADAATRARLLQDHGS